MTLTKMYHASLVGTNSSGMTPRSGRGDLSDEHLPPVDRLSVEHAVLAPGIVVDQLRDLAFVADLDDDQRAVCPVGADGFGWIDELPVLIDLAERSAQQHSTLIHDAVDEVDVLGPVVLFAHRA